MPTTLFLIRHCQSKANSERIYSCSIDEDAGLSEHGMKQAGALCGFFADKNLSALYSSPFPRAIQTAREIAAGKKLKVVEIDELREHGCGMWNGRSENEIMSKFPTEWKGWMTDPQSNPIPGGETLLEMQSRVLLRLNRLARKHDGHAIAVVTHYCVFNVIMCSLFSSLANFRSFDTKNGAVAEIELGNVPRLRMFHCPIPEKL